MSAARPAQRLRSSSRCAARSFRWSFGGLNRSATARPCCACQADAALEHVLVLGGTGFVGTQVSQALLRNGYAVTSVSRRAESSELEDADNVTLLSYDLVQHPDCVREVLESYGPFCAVVHCVGMLLPNQLNALASGSGSVPAQGTSYKAIIQDTATSAADAAADGQPGCPFVFISAAEAGWPEDAPLVPGFLREYLAAKRAVEAHLESLAKAGKLRATVLRPSLVWTPKRPAALVPVAAFTVASKLGLPGVQKPVRVDTVASAVVAAVKKPSDFAVWQSGEMEAQAGLAH